MPNPLPVVLAMSNYSLRFEYTDAYKFKYRILFDTEL